MAVIVDALVSRFTETLSALLTDEVAKIIGAKDELNKLKEKLGLLLDVLVDAEQKAFHDRRLRTWLAKLKDVIYDADDVIDYYRIQAERLAGPPALEQPPSTPMVRCCPPLASCFHRLVVRHQVGGRVRGINARLEEIMKEKNDFQLTAIARSDDHGSSRSRRQSDPLVEPDIVGAGIENDTKDLITQLTMSGGPAISVFAIVGMGGIGKTTLAQKIYNHQTIKDTFQIPPPIWMCVSKEYTDTNLLREIIRLAKGDPGNAQSVGELLPILEQLIKGKKFFLILDDVWDARIWKDLLYKPLQSGAKDSRILITTRNELVAREIGVVNPFRVQPLSSEDSWLLICKIVFKEGEEGEIPFLEDIGMEIVKKCHGLPLAIKSIAGVLGAKAKTRWEWQRVRDNPAWSMTNLPDGVMGVLYLSYQDLPFHLKQCFVFCSLFPEDHVFMRHKLIQLWVAEGFVKEKIGSIMEEEANEYYHELLRRNLLQRDPHYYGDGGCKMHDLLRSLAQFLGQDENFVCEVRALTEASSSSSSSSFVKLRHLSLFGFFIEEFPTILMNHESLRTLLFGVFLVMFSLPNDIFKKLERLRVLDFSGTNITNLPESIGNLIHLRYLDLSDSLLEELPETIGNLSNLQYLILQRCEELESLPKGITKLYKLRSLDLLKTQVDGLPTGIGRLQHLNRLMGFVTNEGSDGNKEWCSLEELRFLSKLRTLTIERLERAMVKSNNGGPILEDKKNLRHLELSCKSHGQQHVEEEQKRIKEIFEVLLSPPESLEKFEIKGYFGLEFPSWMMGNNVSKLFFNLKRLDLRKCRNCRQLPPLGQLPHLDLLKVREAFGIQSIGPEFMGWDSESIQQVAPRHLAFPKLETLDLQELPNWTEWLWEASHGGAMPYLKSLQLMVCPGLRSLPQGMLRHATSLTTLVMQATHINLIEGLLSLKELAIAFNPNLIRISNLPALKILKIVGCPSLRDVDHFQLLHVLELVDLEMESLPEWLAPRDGETELPFPDLAMLKIIVSRADVLRRCLKDGPDWPKIRDYPHAYIEAPPAEGFDEFGNEKKPEFVFYLRDPFTLTTNLGVVAGGGSGSGGDQLVDA